MRFPSVVGVVLRTLFSVWVRFSAWWKGPQPLWTLTAMHLFDETTITVDNDDENSVRNDYWFVHPRDVHLHDWKDFAKHHGCIKPRLEVRYTHASRKYRMVLRDDDVDVSWPPYTDPIDSPGIFKLTLVATIHYADGSKKNVTNRVRKYQGPTLTFHKDLGIQCRVRDMFPFACLDHDEQAYTLEVMTFTGKRFIFKPDDYISLD
jgi:hypothetical protein